MRLVRVCSFALRSFPLKKNEELVLLIVRKMSDYYNLKNFWLLGKFLFTGTDFGYLRGL